MPDSVAVSWNQDKESESTRLTKGRIAFRRACHQRSQGMLPGDVNQFVGQQQQLRSPSRRARSPV
jgi:hypothetical protein